MKRIFALLLIVNGSAKKAEAFRLESGGRFRLTLFPASGPLCGA